MAIKEWWIGGFLMLQATGTIFKAQKKSDSRNLT